MGISSPALSLSLHWSFGCTLDGDDVRARSGVDIALGSSCIAFVILPHFLLHSFTSKYTYVRNSVSLEVFTRQMMVCFKMS